VCRRIASLDDVVAMPLLFCPKGGRISATLWTVVVVRMTVESVTDGGIAVAERGGEADGKVMGPKPQTGVRSVDIAAMPTYFMWPIILLRPVEF
jgi:hypothetical protein